MLQQSTAFQKSSFSWPAVLTYVGPEGFLYGTNEIIIEAAILGVLGLLLGFTMPMAVSRCEVRKELVLDEANAIGTSYLRTELLPAPENIEIANIVSAT